MEKQEYKLTEKERAWHRKYYYKNKDKIKKYHQKYYAEHAEETRKYHKEYYNKNKDQWRERYKKKDRDPLKRRDSELRNKFNITLEDYNYLLNKQDGCCLLCNRHYSEFVKGLAVDHNHETGQIRGLLCGPCNTRLGWFETNMKKIMEYLDA